MADLEEEREEVPGLVFEEWSWIVELRWWFRRRHFGSAVGGGERNVRSEVWKWEEDERESEKEWEGSGNCFVSLFSRFSESLLLEMR